MNTPPRTSSTQAGSARDASATTTRAYIGLGANLGDTGLTLRNAAAELAAAPGITACRLAPLYRSAPVEADGPDYINTVAAIDTTLSPWELLDLLQRIEARHGRDRPYRNAPRTLDLDLLLYGDARLDDDRLTVPHPRMHQRAFVLLPLADLEPSLVLEQGPIAELAAALGQRINRLG